eukprot:1283251-Prymnesium_polylepis.1
MPNAVRHLARAHGNAPPPSVLGDGAADVLALARRVAGGAIGREEREPPFPATAAGAGADERPAAAKKHAQAAVFGTAARDPLLTMAAGGNYDPSTTLERPVGGSMGRAPRETLVARPVGGDVGVAELPAQLRPSARGQTFATEEPARKAPVPLPNGAAGPPLAPVDRRALQKQPHAPAARIATVDKQERTTLK